MTDGFLNKQSDLQKKFAGCHSKEARYETIIRLGEQLPPFDAKAKVDENLVPGCQSVMYLESTCIDGKLYFKADSEALISKGLAALLILVYSGETPETIRECPPLFLKELGLQNSLSPARSNGLASLYLKMRHVASNYLNPAVAPALPR